MISEDQQYRAEVFKIAGFALMTPLGRIVIDYIEIFKQIGPLMFGINLFIAFLLFLVGLTFIEMGRNILDVRSSKKWD